MCACLNNCVALNLRVLLISIVSERENERTRERETKNRILILFLSLSFHLDLEITYASSRHRPFLSFRLRNATNPISLNIDIISLKKPIGLLASFLDRCSRKQESKRETESIIGQGECSCFHDNFSLNCSTKRETTDQLVVKNGTSLIICQKKRKVELIEQLDTMHRERKREREGEY